MSKISAKIIADSLHPNDKDRITTMQVTFPRFLLAELNTHKIFSQTTSIEDISFEELIKSVENNPFIPIAWQKDHVGMQDNEYFIEEDVIISLNNAWLEAKDNAIEKCLNLSIGDGEIATIKQLCSRLLEPFMWHTVLITSTEWENFFELRCPQYFFIYENEPSKFFRSQKDFMRYYESVYKVLTSKEASQTDYDEVIEWLKLNKGQSDIHMMALAESMWDAITESTPKELKPGEWHIPFGDDIKIEDCFKSHPYSNKSDNGFDYFNEVAIKIATARCARISYTIVDEERVCNGCGRKENDHNVRHPFVPKEHDYQKDNELHDQLLNSKNLLYFEHCAKVMNGNKYKRFISGEGDLYDDGSISGFSHNSYGWCRNFRGFIQYRAMIE